MTDKNRVVSNLRPGGSGYSSQDSRLGPASFKLYSLNLCAPWPATHNLLLNFVDLTLTRPHGFRGALLVEKTKIGSIGT